VLKTKLPISILIGCLGVLAPGVISRTLQTEDRLLVVIQHDTTQTLPPILKSKLGVARAAGYSLLPETITYAREMGSRAFCSTISFDEVIGQPRSNYALGTTRFSSDGIAVDATAKLWLQTLIRNLHNNQQQIFLGIVGAPTPFQQPVIRKPAAHPTPTNISASAHLTAQWARIVLPSHPPLNWVIWNEPEHTLRGINSQRAAQEMVDIYKNYQAAFAGSSSSDGFGLASFMKASLRDLSDLPGQTFAHTVLQSLANSQSTPIDFITLNSYHGGTDSLVTSLAEALSNVGLDQPLVLNQFAPEVIGSNPTVAGSIEAASLYLQYLDGFTRHPEIASACFSFWSGPDRKALLREDRQAGFSKSLPFKALSWYQRMPLWRLMIHPSYTDMPYAVWASSDGTYTQVLIAPKVKPDSGPIPAGVKGKASRKALRKELRQVERTNRRQSLRDHQESDTYDSLSKPSPLALQLPDYPDREVALQRLSESRGEPAVERLRTDRHGRLLLTVTPSQIVLLSIGTEPSMPPLLPILRTDLYIHRPSQKHGWASVDPIHDGFVLAVPTQNSVAHASALYQAEKIRSKLTLQFKTPNGVAAGIMKALSCSALLIQKNDQKDARVLAAWGSTSVVKRMMQTRAFTTQDVSLSDHLRPWER